MNAYAVAIELHLDDSPKIVRKFKTWEHTNVVRKYS